MTLALIDGDIVAYRSAAACQREHGWNDDGPTFLEEDVVRYIEQTLDQWVTGAGCTSALVLLTGEGNFRKAVSPTYKANRKDTAKPLALGFARTYLVEKHGARIVDGLEADDLIGLSLTGSKSDATAVSIDKDLRTIPGKHFNPMKDRWPVEVDEKAADKLWLTQTLTGDAVDGYPGCPGIGPAKAPPIVKGGWGAVEKAFVKAGQTIEDAITQARLARILRRGDYDKDSKEVLLWHPVEPVRFALATASAS